MRSVVILDRQGASRANQDLKFATAFVPILMNNFPERLSMECVIEPNWVFKIAYTAVKIFLSKATIEKIKLLGGLKDLKQWFDDDQLIVAHGGTAEITFDAKTEFGL